MQAAISFKFNKGIYHAEKFVGRHHPCTFRVSVSLEKLIMHDFNPMLVER